MKPEKPIIPKWKLHLLGLVVIVLVQGTSIALIIHFLKELIQNESVRCVLLMLVLTSCLLVDFYFLWNRVFMLWYAMNKLPIKCRLEDILLVGYRNDKKMYYTPIPIVRSIVDKKLYITYDKYSLSGVSSHFDYSDKNNIRCTIYKDNGSLVSIGDIVDMYILKTVDIPIYIDRERNTICLNRKKAYFHHMNDQVDIEVLRDIVVFKGTIIL